jgi:glycosyltransferase involved in cell wall biosynthesis
MISVLLPFRDARGTLGDAIRSVLAEPEVREVIAVDDGSSDGGADVARAIGDARVVVVRTGGVGVAGALAAGLARARGDLVARMDADDVSLPGRIAAQRAMMDADPTLAAVGTLVEVDGATGPGMRAYVAWQNSVLSPADHARDIFVESPLCHPSTLIRRRALEAVGGWREAPWPEDWDLWLRFDAAGHRLAKARVVGLRWRHREDRATFRDPRCSPERLVAARAHYLAERLRLAPRFAVWGAGKTGRRLARALEGHGLRASAFVDIDPRKIGRTARGAPIIPPEGLQEDASPVVVAVGERGARDVVRRRLAARGLVEGRDFVCAA